MSVVSWARKNYMLYHRTLLNTAAASGVGLRFQFYDNIPMFFFEIYFTNCGLKFYVRFIISPHRNQQGIPILYTVLLLEYETALYGGMYYFLRVFLCHYLFISDLISVYFSTGVIVIHLCGTCMSFLLQRYKMVIVSDLRTLQICYVAIIKCEHTSTYMYVILARILRILYV